MSHKVLVIDDDVVVRTLVIRLLEQAGHRVVWAEAGPPGLKLLWAERPDLVVLDVTMPEMDGWQVLERVRELSEVPVIMLTASGDELEKVRGLRAGADDYVTKPFGRQELLARVENLLRRHTRSASAERAPDVYADAVVTVDHGQRLVSAAGTELALTPREFALMSAFVRNPGQVLSSDQLIELVWGDPYIEPDQVKLLVARLRRKLRDHVDPDPVETVRGFGYRYRPPSG